MIRKSIEIAYLMNNRLKYQTSGLFCKFDLSDLMIPNISLLTSRLCHLRYSILFLRGNGTNSFQLDDLDSKLLDTEFQQIILYYIDVQRIPEANAAIKLS